MPLIASLKMGLRDSRSGRSLDLITLPALWGVELLILWIRMQDHGSVNFPALFLVTTLLYMPLFWRREYPLVVYCWLVAASSAASVLAPGFHPIFCLWLGLYSAAAHCQRRRALVSLLLSGVPVSLNVAETLRDTSNPTDHPIILIAVTLFLSLANITAFGIGRWARWIVEQRMLVARLAEAEERRRIARELHDVVAHAVSLMVLQAAGAERVLSNNPDRARTALRQVGELGEQAIAELRRMLGYLTPASPPQGDDLVVSVRLEEISILVDHLRSAGREVVLSSRGQPLPLEQTTDAAAYRIVQEALTNAVKYADPRQPIQLDVTWKADTVELSVRTHGSAIPDHGGTSHLSTGNGIRSMRERAQAVGGTVTAGATADGGYRVFAQLPASEGSVLAKHRRRGPLNPRTFKEWI